MAPVFASAQTLSTTTSSHTPLRHISASSNSTRGSWPWSNVISPWNVSLSLQTKEQPEGERDMFKGREEYQCSLCFHIGNPIPILRYSLTLNLSNLVLPVCLPKCFSFYVNYSSSHLATTVSSSQQLKPLPQTFPPNSSIARLFFLNTVSLTD